MAGQFPNPNGSHSLLVIDNSGGQAYAVAVTPSPYGTNNIQLDNLLPSYTMSGYLLNKATGVNLNTATEQTLFTVPAGKTCFVRAIMATNPSTSLTTVSWSIGFNTGTDTNVVANATHTALTAAALYEFMTIIAGASSGSAGGLLNLKNNVLQGGAATADFYVFGWLQ